MDANFSENIAAAVKEANSSLGHVNVLIAGRSGVGKSTLINAVFRENLAETGQGRPVTTQIREITKENMPVSIYDSRGLEMQEYKQTIDELMDFVRGRNADVDPARHIHVAWICIHEDSRRVEPAETVLHEELAKYVPVIGVITKHRSDQGFKSEVEKLLPHCRNYVQVRAIEEVFDEDVTLKPKGLDLLVDLTISSIPEGARRAFAASQNASLKVKQSEARKVIAAAATVAGGAGLSPVPFSDAFIIAPIQVGMLAKITTVFGISLSNNMLTSLVTTAAGVGGASLAGRTIVSGVLKMIPGVGTAAGAAISAGTAVALTTALGEAYTAALVAIFSDDPNADPTGEEIGNKFKQMMRNALS